MRVFDYYNAVLSFEFLKLSLADSPTANLLIGTTSGNGFEVEWGDGVWVSYTNNQNVTKTYGSNFTGNIRVRTLLGLGDITRFEINNATNKYTFDLSALNGLVNLKRLSLYSNTSACTGNIATLSSSLTHLYLESNASSWTGNISTLSSSSLTHLYLLSLLSTWTYTTKVWSIVPTVLFLRPKVASFTSTMTDQLLIDLSVATIPVFTGKTIDLRGNCGAKTSLSNSAVAIITGGGGIVLTN